MVFYVNFFSRDCCNNQYKRIREIHISFFVIASSTTNNLATKYLDSNKVTPTNYKENVKRSQFWIPILENRIIQTESANLKILNFNANLITVYVNKWFAMIKQGYLIAANHLFYLGLLLVRFWDKSIN